MDYSFLFFSIFSLNGKNLILDKVMIFAADYVIYLTIALLFIAAIKGGAEERKALILFSLSVPILILIIKIIHLFIFQQRPFIEEDIIPLISLQADASFPSRHASIMVSIAFSYAFFKSRLFPYLLALAFWVGFARIYVGVHYPFDILGGFFVGFISVLLARILVRFLRSRLL